MYRIVAVAAILGTGGTTLTVWGAPGATRPTAALALVAGLVLATGWCIRDVLVNTRGLGGARMLSIVAGAGLLALPFLPPPDPLSAPAISYVNTLVICAMSTGLAWGPAAGVVMSIAAGVAIAVEETPRVGPLHADLVALNLTLVGLAGAALIWVQRRLAASVERAAARELVIRQTVAEEAEREATFDRWAAAIHDSVVGALRLAGLAARWSAETAGQQLASAGLTALGASARAAAIPPVGDDVVAAVTARAEALGLTLHLDQDGQPPRYAVGAALAVAATEAITNVARHSGQNEAWVALRATRTGTVVTVTDRGLGFRAHEAAGRHTGLRVGMQLPMTAVGGRASVDSAPGRGTVVTLTAPHPSTPDDPAPHRAGADLAGHPAYQPAGQPHRTPQALAGWNDTGLRRPFRWLVVALSASFPAVGACHLDEVRSVAVFVGLAALILGLVVASLWLTGFPRLAPVWAAASIGLAVVGFGNLADPQTTGWAWWFIGMQDTLLVVLGIRSGARWALSVALGIPAAILLTAGVAGWALPWVALREVMPQLIACALLGISSRRAMHAATATINAAGARVSKLELVPLLGRVRQAEFARLVAGLGPTVAPTLSRLAQPRDLTADERSHCRRLESAVRDELVAHPVLDPGVRAALAAARARDADVEVTATVATGHSAPPAFGAVLQEVLRYAVRDSRVRAHWRCAPGQREGSIVLVAVELADPSTAAALTVALVAQAAALTDALAEARAAQAAATRTGATDPGGSDHSDDSVNPADSFRWTLDQDSLFVEFGSSTLSA